MTYVILYLALSALGTWAALRICRAGDNSVPPSQIPTLRSPALPEEFRDGTWRTL